LTLDEFLDIRGDQMRLMRFVDDDWTETARNNAARQAFAEVVRLFLVVRFVAHALCPFGRLE
jgi:hypothetical protein